MTKKLTPQEKKERKPASRACTFCHSKHLQCSDERPCRNCVKRNRGDECQDVARKRARYLTKKKNSIDATSITDSTPMLLPKLEPMPNHLPMEPQIISRSQLDGNLTHDVINDFSFPQNNMLNTTKDVLNRMLFDNNPQHPPHQDDPSPMRSLSINFTSNYLNEEYLMLGDIIKTKPSSPSLSATSMDQQELLDFDMVSNKLMKKMKDSRPFISLGYDNSSNNANIANLDNNLEKGSNINLYDLEKLSRDNSTNNLKKILQNVEYISPLMTHNMYQSVHDIYSNRQMNFDYPQSYHSLTKFLKSRFLGNNLPAEEKALKRNNLLIILKLIASYRPTFISAHKNLLKPQDLQFLEMTFQRSLIDYEKLCQLNSCPTIMWRRTGEIVLITDDLLSLLGYNMGELLSKRTFIMELMYDDDSIINYFKKFKFIAVGNLLSSVQTTCKLKRKNLQSTSSNIVNSFHGTDQQNDYIDFMSVWTVKRDIFDMPMLIIGQFLPVLPQSEGMRIY